MFHWDANMTYVVLITVSLIAGFSTMHLHFKSGFTVLVGGVVISSLSFFAVAEYPHQSYVPTGEVIELYPFPLSLNGDRDTLNICTRYDETIIDAIRCGDDAPTADMLCLLGEINASNEQRVLHD